MIDTPSFFLIMAAIYLSYEVSPRVRQWLGIAFIILAALTLVIDFIKVVLK